MSALTCNFSNLASIGNKLDQRDFPHACTEGSRRLHVRSKNVPTGGDFVHDVPTGGDFERNVPTGGDFAHDVPTGADFDSGSNCGEASFPTQNEPIQAATKHPARHSSNQSFSSSAPHTFRLMPYSLSVSRAESAHIHDVRRMAQPIRNVECKPSGPKASISGRFPRRDFRKRRGARGTVSPQGKWRSRSGHRVQARYEEERHDRST